MFAFRSTDMSQEFMDLLGSVEAGPTVLINRGQPRAVLMSAEEFRRLKTAAGEAVPTAALPVRPLILRGEEPYPLFD